jgi:hypothetical protein
VKSRNRISIAKPRRIASHTTRKSVLPNPASLKDVVELASACCCAALTINLPYFSTTQIMAVTGRKRLGQRFNFLLGL